MFKKQEYLYNKMEELRRLAVNEEASRRLTEQQGVEYTVLELTDRSVISDTQVHEIGHELLGYVDSHPDTNICLGFSGVEFFSSAGLGRAIAADNKLKYSSRRGLRMMGMRPELFEVLRLTKLDQLFDIDEQTRQAYLDYKSR